ncbi:hypothetical protein IVA95_05575 [Bradyrhizobium sp. 157]|uniref:hypothetical protein n=1 Tax=Bradyrhizobium sp. 157 TaxID=2782631 RepID=UPI001FF9E069|nr:hypothetical protein [Bradyrhizobium sp. 157]MCK1637060.1 hypothetical protein [Bradyrhizobium sp. 157]
MSPNTHVPGPYIKPGDDIEYVSKQRRHLPRFQRFGKYGAVDEAQREGVQDRTI